MFLIPLDETIEFNQTEVTSSFFTGIHIVAFTYHPIYEQFLYLLFAFASRSGVHNLMIWNSYTKQYLQNITLIEQFNCTGKCTLKVTENLLLIQSPTIISIYRISQFKANAIRVNLYNKQTGSAYDGISRQADIYKQKFVFFKSNQTIFGQVTSTSHTTFLYSFNITNSPSLQIGLSNEFLYVVYNATNISVMFFKCVACIYDGRLTYPPSNISSYVSHINFDKSFLSSIKVYKGDQKVTYQNKLGYIFWAIIDGIQFQYFTNTISIQKLYVKGIYQVEQSSNGKSLIVYNQSDGFFEIKSFQPYNLSSYIQNYDFGRIIKKAAIASNLETYAIFDSIDSYKLTQYQMVASCQPYNAQVSILNTLFCNCTLYNEYGRCALKQAPLSSTQFPIYGIIGIVASVVLIILGAYFLKNNYKKCLKSSKRTPWKYNPVELMSFEV